jgi:hypothetical protein
VTAKAESSCSFSWSDTLSLSLSLSFSLSSLSLPPFLCPSFPLSSLFKLFDFAKLTSLYAVVTKYREIHLFCTQMAHRDLLHGSFQYLNHVLH